MKLAGRVAVVTGGGRGIGRAIALAFAREGAKVVLTSRTEAELSSAAEEVRRAGGEALTVRCDVTSEAEVQAMADAAVRRFGQVDILVNNAAINLPVIHAVDMKPEEWRRVIDVNLTGPFLCARAVLPHMIKRGSGKVSNISSTGGRVGARGRGPYRATKAALINFTETLAAEVHQQGIDVVCLCPGGAYTDMMRALIPDLSKATGLMRPEDIAEVVLFLAADDRRLFSGASIDVPGPSSPLLK